MTSLNLRPRTSFLARLRLVILLLALLSVLEIRPVLAQENWCTDNSSNCVCSEPFQHTSYTTVSIGAGSFNAIGNNSNTKRCLYGGQALSFQSAYGTHGDMRDRVIGTDATVLSRLPNRDAARMARYIRPNADNFGGGGAYPSTFRAGYDPINLTGVKRIALRFYRYFSEGYEFAFQGSCTNGKLAHNSARSFRPPYYTLQSYGSFLGANYSFISPDWTWLGHSNLRGFKGWMRQDGKDGAQNLNGFRGKWVRIEIVVRRPKLSDSRLLGYDLEAWLTNVTDGGAPKQDTRLSAGCTNCLDVDGLANVSFVWTPGVYPNADMESLHVEDYRAGTCAGWTAYAYLAVATWTTDAGQMIGPASEVEKPSVGPRPNAPTNLGVR